MGRTDLPRTSCITGLRKKRDQKFRVPYGGKIFSGASVLKEAVEEIN